MISALLCLLLPSAPIQAIGDGNSLSNQVRPVQSPTPKATPSRQVPNPNPAVATQPGDSLVNAALRLRALTPATWIRPARVLADFDGDGKTDIALLVAHSKTGKRGILIVHGGKTAAAVAGAGVSFGNGGDDFEWANKWQVVKRKGKPDALLVEREESGGGLIEFVNGRYRWRQHGD